LETGAQPSQPPEDSEQPAFQALPILDFAMNSTVSALVMSDGRTLTEPDDHKENSDSAIVVDAHVPSTTELTMAPVAHVSPADGVANDPEAAQQPARALAPTTPAVAFDLLESQSLADAASSPVADVHETQTIPVDARFTLHVTALETHLPDALARAASNMAALIGAEGVSAPVKLGPIATRRDAAVKILRFELQPASLGALVVKMRMTQACVEIEIESQSVSTVSRLNELRDRITNAVAATGCVVEAIDLRIAPPLAPDTGQPQANDGRPPASQGFQSQRQDFSDGSKSGSRNHPQPQSQPKTGASPRNDGGGGAGGVYL
jgi:hypothetical protein